jgi:nondiscriminating glutamyl-tRNA synthetase
MNQTKNAPAEFRTRQAPSPTGYLHLGNARTMLFTKLITILEQGKFFIRVEDTDQTRLQKDAVVILLSVLDKLGIEADEGVTLVPSGQSDDFYGVYQKGEFGPYIQSQRLAIYHTVAEELISKKLAYWSYLTSADKENLQQIKQVNKHPINYFKICSEKYPDTLFQSVAQGLGDQQKPVLLYKLQRNSKVICHDELLGVTEFDLSLEEDFGILKSDGFPTYHLAHLVDDFAMKTSLVIRGQEWFPSYPKHKTMFEDMYGQAPKYMHLPVILGESGNKKMSKRDGNVNLQDYLDKGYMPEAIINYLSFLGWNPGTEKELYLEQSEF